MAGDRNYAHRSRVDKLGVKPGQSVVWLGPAEHEALTEIRERAAVTVGEVLDGADLVVAWVDDAAALAQLPAWAARLQRAGGIWVVWPRGGRALREDDVRAAALANGLVDVKVMRFSETHAALKLVIPRHLR